MDLTALLTIARRGWLLLVTGAEVGLIVAALYSVSVQPAYTATAQAFVSTSSATSASDLNQSGTFAQQIAKSYAQLAATPYVLSPVIRELRLDESISALEQRVSTSASADTVLISISVTDPSSIRAATIANAIGKELGVAVDALTPDTAGTTSSVDVTLVQTASPPSSPVRPQLPFSLILGALLGTLVAVAALLIRNRVDDRVQTADDMRSTLAVPLLGTISRTSSSRREPRGSTPASRAINDEYKVVQTNIDFTRALNGRNVLLITSASMGDGKTTVALELARTYAEGGVSTLLVEADLRRPTIAERLGLDGTLGLAHLLASGQSLEVAIQYSGLIGADVLPAGTVPPNPVELLRSTAMKELLGTLRSRYDVLIVDSPPIDGMADAMVLSALDLHVVIVARSGKTRARDLLDAFGTLTASEASLVGAVLTAVPPSGSQRYYQSTATSATALREIVASTEQHNAD